MPKSKPRLGENNQPNEGSVSPRADSGGDSFWGNFDKEMSKNKTEVSCSIDSEFAMWSGISAPSRSADPIHVMEGLNLSDFPRIYLLFRKFSIFPSTQNKDERLFSLIGRNTGSLGQRLKVETIEKKVVVGRAI